MSSAKELHSLLGLLLVATVPQLDLILAGALFRKECIGKTTICQARQSRD
jgi:hypothetical protein